MKVFQVMSVMLMVLLSNCGQDKKKVIVYSPHDQTLLEDVAIRFEEETGIVVEFLQLGTDRMIERARAEKEKPLADILYGGSASYYAELTKEGMLEPTQPTWAPVIDASFKDSEGYWYGVMQTPAVLYYNTNNIAPANVPKDWYDITNAQYKNKLIWLGAGGTINTFITIMGMNNSQRGGEAGAKLWFEKLNDNISEYFNNSGMSYPAMNSPAGGISMFVLPFIADGIYNYGYPWAIVPTKSGVITIIDTVAAIKGSPNPEEAKIFMEWVGSTENQVSLANDFNRMPTDPEALKSSPQWMGEFDLPSMDVEWGEVAQKMAGWVKIYEEIRSK